MKLSSLYYSVGALLYCPANNTTIAESIIQQKFDIPYSLALCLEDTIADNCVTQAEQILLYTIKKINGTLEKKQFYLPKLFVRVRSAEQMLKLYQQLKPYQSLISGFIVPKFSLDVADAYLYAIQCINGISSKPIYIMPIYESASMIDLRTRSEILYLLKEKLDSSEELVLNIRIGGNDLCHLFGYRRHVNESIHQIRPIANLFSDIITVYGMDYVISGPVWEYFSGNGWETGLKQEIIEDKLAGFIGKTVIHPKQISIVNQAYQVSAQDFADAKAILNWNSEDNRLVTASADHVRMNEYKTHWNWARQIQFQAQIFGIKV
ncbi:MAG: HpcH/HpaI aldolase/citrate lyase family protein [Lachnospiraceae bacterium]